LNILIFPLLVPHQHFSFFNSAIILQHQKYISTDINAVFSVQLDNKLHAI